MVYCLYLAMSLRMSATAFSDSTGQQAAAEAEARLFFYCQKAVDQAQDECKPPTLWVGGFA
ncbi:hypothetical protein THUN1379_23880 [Paludibacterium sp. THUN1379]|nr:hypothetical protein THUN1379_23880 [Paludibacterium sp. THUN1379]